MAKATKTEHSGGKNRGGFWGRRAEAKTVSRKLRRRQAAEEIRAQEGNVGKAFHRISGRLVESVAWTREQKALTVREVALEPPAPTSAKKRRK